MSVVTFTFLDLALLAFFAVLLLGVGFWKKSDASSFFLGARRLSLPVFVMTLTATWYGGILGVGEFTYRYGLSNWVTQGLPYYIFAAAFAWFFAKKIHDLKVSSLVELLENKYGSAAGRFGAGLVFIMTSPAPYVLMLGVLIELIFGIPFWVAVLLGAVLSTVYLWQGGFDSDVRTDLVEFCFMFAGFVCLLFFCQKTFGPLDQLPKQLPSSHMTWHGGKSFGFIFAWFWIALWTFVDPSFYQKCVAAQNSRVAQKGIFISILFWALFDFLTLSTALYARAALPDLESPQWAYPLLAEKILPSGWKGLFWIGLLATVISTLNSYAFLSAQTLGKDFLAKKFDADHPVRWTRVGLVISMGLGVVLSLRFRSVIELWFMLSSLVVPGLLWVSVCAYQSKAVLPQNVALWSMVSGTAASVLWFSQPGLTHFCDALYPGLLVSGAICLWGLAKMRKMV